MNFVNKSGTREVCELSLTDGYERGLGRISVVRIHAYMSGPGSFLIAEFSNDKMIVRKDSLEDLGISLEIRE